MKQFPIASALLAAAMEIVLELLLAIMALSVCEIVNELETASRWLTS